MDADGHSVLVDEYLTEAEARALQSAAEVLYELEERAGRRAYGDVADDVRIGARIHEAAKITRERMLGFLITMKVYAESPPAERALDDYRSSDDAETDS